MKTIIEMTDQQKDLVKTKISQLDKEALSKRLSGREKRRWQEKKLSKWAKRNGL